MFVEYLANILAIESVIGLARDVKMTFEERLQAQDKATMLQPGDLILTKTPSCIYQMFRNLGGPSDYDHISVVLDETYSLHISYPRAKKVPTTLFTHIKREPMVIRPLFQTPEHKETFIKALQYEALGRQYDMNRVVHMLFSIQVYNLGKYNDKKTDKVVCSHQIYRCLRDSMPSFKRQVKEDKSLEYHKYGTFSIQDFVRLQIRNPQSFQIISLYQPSDFPGKKDDKKQLSAITMEKSGLKFAESLLDKVMQIKLSELLAEYLLSVILRDKAGVIMSRIFMLRAQFILLVALLKIVKMGTKFVTWKRKANLFKL